MGHVVECWKVDVSRISQGQTSGGFLLLGVVSVSHLLFLYFLTDGNLVSRSWSRGESLVGASLRTLIEP